MGPPLVLPAWEVAERLGSPTATKGRTFAADFGLTFLTNGHQEKRDEPKKLYRNPIALAQEWQGRITKGQARSRADLTRQLGVSRPHVAQVLRILRLTLRAKEEILGLGDPIEGRIAGAHSLRALVTLPADEQVNRSEEPRAARPQRDSLESALTLRPSSTAMGECRGRLAADNRWGLVDELVILKGDDHEESEVHTTCLVALEDGVARVPAPHRQALTLSLFQVTSAHDSPPCVTGEHAPACFALIVEVGEAEEPR